MQTILVLISPAPNYGDHQRLNLPARCAISCDSARIVQAGSSQELTLPSTADLTAAITDAGPPAGAKLSSFWTKVIGPGSVSFSTASFDGTDNVSARSNPSGPWSYGSTPG